MSIAVARRDLAEIFEAVLPGRVDPYGTGQNAPAVRVGVALPIVRESRIGARFPITIVHDGSDKAQVAGLDEITSKVCDAVRATRGMHFVVARSAEVTIRGSVYPSVVVDVDVIFAGRSWCAPDVTEASVPPPVLSHLP